MRVLIAAGGTGGHLYPGVALAREFARLEPGSEAIFVGTDRGLETKVVPREGFELITITARGVMGRGMWGAVQGLAAVPVGLLQCLAICRQRRPDLAIGIGGYTSPPLVLAAFLLGIKRAILEPNVHPGVANRVLSPFANLIFVSFAATVPFFAPGKTRIVGTPIRREFLEARERDYEQVAAAYRSARLEAEVSPFIFDAPRAFRQADLLVSRSGATTVAEITACVKPAILIPFPHAIHGHQERNARILEEAGAATVILDAELTGEALAAAITDLLANPGRLGEMGRCSKGLGRADSAERVVMACRALVGKGGALAGGAPSR